MRKSLFIAVLALACVFALFLLAINKPGNQKVLDLPVAEGLRPLPVSAVILPHHDLVRSQRQEVLEEIRSKEAPTRIIIVSPNHFSAGEGEVITTARTWHLGGGQMDADTNVVDALSVSNVARKEDGPFASEHGIYNILGDLINYFPKAKVVPIILRQNVSADTVTAVAENLNQICTENCLLVASVDFSHYQPASLAELHDDLSMRALSNLDSDLISNAEVDSWQSLAVAISWAKLHGDNKFVLKNHTNSGLLANDQDGESTSHVFGWYEDGPVESVNDEFTFIAAGDMMFDRGIDYHFRDEKIFDVFDQLGDRVFAGVDLSMANLEGPISDVAIQPDNTKNNLIFNFPPRTPKVLKWLHINAVGLANNHTLNNGQKGFESTVSSLVATGITPIGQELGFKDSSIKRLEKGKAKVSIIAVNVLENSQDLAPTITAEKSSGRVVIIYPHWGTEYETQHSTAQAQLAHKWVDAGADLVIGSHPHVVEDVERYKNRLIFYSVGNFLFDQDFSAETQQGLIVAGKIKAGAISEVVILPTVSRSYKPQLERGEKRSAILDKLNIELGLPSCKTNPRCDKIQLN